jgi:hypothetical protein
MDTLESEFQKRPCHIFQPDLFCASQFPSAMVLTLTNLLVFAKRATSLLRNSGGY